jgi:hypothetical protein
MNRIKIALADRVAQASRRKRNADADVAPTPTTEKSDTRRLASTIRNPYQRYLVVLAWIVL